MSGTGSGNRVITGTSDPDTLIGTAINNLIDGVGADDRINGCAGNDSINGNIDDDGIAGGPGHDALEGGEGDDVIKGDSGNDQLSGGPGVNVSYRRSWKRFFHLQYRWRNHHCRFRTQFRCYERPLHFSTGSFICSRNGSIDINIGYGKQQ